MNRAAPPNPPLQLQRLALIATGSVAAADLPFWATWLRTTYPDLEVTAVLTRSARRFVSAAALSGRLRGRVLEDVWPEDVGDARHVSLHRWAEGFLVFPCTLDYLARLALGMGDSPSMLAAQCTTAPIVLAPALPPGGQESPAYRRHAEAVVQRPNVTLVPPQPGTSVTTKEHDAWAPALLPDCINALSSQSWAANRLDRDASTHGGAAG